VNKEFPARGCGGASQLSIVGADLKREARQRLGHMATVTHSGKKGESMKQTVIKRRRAARVRKEGAFITEERPRGKRGKKGSVASGLLGRKPRPERRRGTGCPRMVRQGEKELKSACEVQEQDYRGNSVPQKKKEEEDDSAAGGRKSSCKRR